MLGPVEVRRDGEPVPVPGGKTAELLVRLALEAGVPVRADRLLDDLWARRRDTSRNTLQSKVARLRRASATAASSPAATAATGSRSSPPRSTRSRVLRDAAAATALFDAGDDAGAAELSAAALALFPRRRAAGAGDGDWVAPHRARLEEARVELIETRFAARLRLGDVGDVIGELEAAVAAHPYQEGLWELLITALYRPAGRPTRWPPTSGSGPGSRTSSASSRGRGCRSSSSRS